MARTPSTMLPLGTQAPDFALPDTEGGIVRLADIDQDNRVPSIRVADARIAYSGAGAVQRSGRPGWLSRFFSVVTPF